LGTALRTEKRGSFIDGGTAFWANLHNDPFLIPGVQVIFRKCIESSNRENIVILSIKIVYFPLFYFQIDGSQQEQSDIYVNPMLVETTQGLDTKSAAVKTK